MFRPLRITFALDGSGVYYDPAEPIMLAGLLAVCAIRHHQHGEPPSRDEPPFDVPLPLQRWERDGTWGWHASALFPVQQGGVAPAESLLRWRKRFRQSRVDLTTGSPNLTNGTYRDWDMPLPVLLCQAMVAYAYGEAYEVRRELRRHIRWLGKKRAHGRGRVVGIEVDQVDDDLSVVNVRGAAQQFLPAPDGVRLVRTRPPYWNVHGRVRCCEIGDVAGA